MLYTIHLKFTPTNTNTPNIWTHRETFYQNNNPLITDILSIRNYGNTEMRIQLTTSNNITPTEADQLIDEYIATKSQQVQATPSENFLQDIQNNPHHYTVYTQQPKLNNPHYTIEILGIMSVAA